MKTLILFAILVVLIAGFSGNAARMEILIHQGEQCTPIRMPGLQ